MEQVEYDVHAAVEDRHWWWRARREILRDVIARFRPTTPADGLRIAELGCSSGGNLSMLSEFGSVIGAEMEERAIELLREKRGDTFQVIRHSIPEQLPGRFHVLCLFDVLEHIADDAAAMRWAASQLEPGGIVVITVPAFPFLWTEQDDAVKHYRRYVPEQLAGLLPPELTLSHLTFFNTLLFLPITGVRAVMNAAPKRPRPPRSHLGIPPEPVNSILFQVFRLERHLAPRMRLPLGVSLLLVARRTTD